MKLTRSNDDDRAEEADFWVGQFEGVEPLGEVKHGVHEEPCIGSAVNGVPLQNLSVEADHGVVLGVEHAGEADEQNFEYSSLEEGHLVLLGEEREPGDPLGKFNDASNGGGESLGEVLEEFLLACEWLRIRIQRASL